MKALNLLIRFLLELSALGALDYWGFHAAEGAMGLLLALGAPILFAVLWGLFAANKAKFPPPALWKAVVGCLLLEVTPLVLVSTGQNLWAAVLAGVIVVNSGVVYWRRYQ